MSHQLLHPSAHRRVHAKPAALGPWLLVPLFALVLPLDAIAGDAHVGVKNKHGEIVVMRDVPSRMATRQQPPGLALIVDPRPNRQLDAALGTATELSDSDIASMGASPPSTVAHRVNGAMAGLLPVDTANTGGRTVSPGNAASGTNPMGAVGNATRGIGDQVRQTMQALPLPTQGPGH